MPIRTLLVANRGEIARRIVRTARTMGIDTVAVYADPDEHAPFVHEADRAVPLRGTTAADSYLDIEKILAGAARTGADAVHPGYGFLSENPRFAQAVRDAGLTWVGPSPEAIAAMGDKLTALATMQAAGVPTLPRKPVGELVDEDLIEIGRRVGYPLMVKASAGGGGKGMRVIDSEDDLLPAVTSARRESAKAFGDDTVFLERFVRGGRHIEVQVLGDVHGNVRHLYERECSIQRRHQKIVEECPSPFVGSGLRERMCGAAAAAASAVGYVGAGTVEFIVGEDGSYFFLEMNTRLQVEHPVTENATGIDLVRQQLLLAQGEPLDLPVQIPLDGHAIEVRIYAEDPSHEFLPQTGTVQNWTEPDGVRVDSGVTSGTVIGPQFDPMLAKVIADAPTRREAAQKLSRALRQMRVHGVRTNRNLLRNIVEHEAFLVGDTTTDFFAVHAPAPTTEPAEEDVRLGALAAALAARERYRAALPAGRPIPRSLPSGYRNNRSQGLPTRYTMDERVVETSYWVDRDGWVNATVDGHHRRARVHSWNPPTLDLQVDAERMRLSILAADERVWVDGPGVEVALSEIPRFPTPEAGQVEGGLVAPINGTVVAVEAREGAHVSAGGTIVVLEAMKMEHRVKAPHDGVVETVMVQPGAVVSMDELLAVLSSPHAGV